MISATPLEKTPLLCINKLGFSRHSESVFGPFDLELMKGDIVFVEGANGAGKTTLLRILIGSLTATEGQITFHTEPSLSSLPSCPLAFLGHQLGIKNELTCLENLHFTCGILGSRAKISVTDALSRVGLEGYADAFAQHLSAGQKKRLALARLLLNPAPLWILDEPYAHLDLQGITLVNELINDQARHEGGVLVTSHGAYTLHSERSRRVSLTRNA